MNELLPEPTFCEDCDHVALASRKQPEYRWLCIKHRRLEGQGFVSRKAWVEHEPFLRCNDVNKGACPLFEPRKDQP